MRKKQHPHPHDLLFAEVFSRKEVAEHFIRHFAGYQLPLHRLRLETLRLEPTSFVKPDMKRVQSDLVFSCQYGEGQTVEISIILEHKSTRPDEPHFQLLDYVSEKWRQEKKQKKARTPAICILLYHGKAQLKYKPMGQYINGMDDELARFNPLFDFVLVDLAHFADEVILRVKTMFLVNTLLLFKHSGDTAYFRENLEKILIFANEYVGFQEGQTFMRTLFVYITGTTELSAKDIADIGRKSPELKDSIMQGKTLLDYFAEEIEEKGVQIGVEKGVQIGVEKGVHQKEVALIRRDWKKGLPPAEIASICDVPIEKVLAVIQQLELEKKANKPDRQDN